MLNRKKKKSFKKLNRKKRNETKIYQLSSQFKQREENFAKGGNLIAFFAKFNTPHLEFFIIIFFFFFFCYCHLFFPFFLKWRVFLLKIFRTCTVHAHASSENPNQFLLFAYSRSQDFSLFE